MTIRSYILLLALGGCLATRAQEHPEKPFISPFDFPLTLSGNFGELRANHFHGGVDFKTQGEIGKPIHCIADGYVSRVSVTPGGYGQALYITHPNGYTPCMDISQSSLRLWQSWWKNISMRMRLLR